MNIFGIAKIDQTTLREEIYLALYDAFIWCNSSLGMVLNLRGLGDRCFGMAMVFEHLIARRLMAEGAFIESGVTYVTMQNSVKLSRLVEKKIR